MVAMMAPLDGKALGMANRGKGFAGRKLRHHQPAGAGDGHRGGNFFLAIGIGGDATAAIAGHGTVLQRIDTDRGSGLMAISLCEVAINSLSRGETSRKPPLPLPIGFLHHIQKAGGGQRGDADQNGCHLHVWSNSGMAIGRMGMRKAYADHRFADITLPCWRRLDIVAVCVAVVLASGCRRVVCNHALRGGDKQAAGKQALVAVVLAQPVLQGIRLLQQGCGRSAAN
jgi:hypothetical protein